MLRRKNKKAAIEMSIGTIVVIVIAMVMLIMGVVLVRKIMCGGILLTDKITRETESEITNLFGSDDFGVRCVGEIEQERMGSGGSRPVVCIINSLATADYELRFVSAQVTGGRISNLGNGADAVNLLTGKKGWKGKVVAGKTPIRVATINIPRDIDTSTVSLTFKEFQNNIEGQTHDIVLELVPVGSFKAAIC